MIDLHLIQAMVAGNKHAATHYFICFGIAISAGFMSNIFKARLTQDVTGKYSPGLDISFLQKYLHISALKRGFFTKRGGKSQPACARARKLLISESKAGTARVIGLVSRCWR